MKTPQRTRAFVSMFVTRQACLNALARYKRKNKIKQLKRSLQRYKRIEHLPFYTPIWHACRLMLDLKHPSKNYDLNEYNDYFKQLEEISVHLGLEMRRIGFIAGGKLATSSENKEKKHP